MSLFLPKFLRFLPYPLINFKGRNPSNFWLAFWEKRCPHKFILNLTDLYILLTFILSKPAFLQHYTAIKLVTQYAYPLNEYHLH